KQPLFQMIKCWTPGIEGKWPKGLPPSITGPGKACGATAGLGERKSRRARRCPSPGHWLRRNGLKQGARIVKKGVVKLAAIAYLLRKVHRFWCWGKPVLPCEMHSYTTNKRSISEERMKYNRWTVALAALGLVSFASAAKAEEKASPVMTALSSTTISGYVDTSAEWNPGTGNGNLPAYKFNGPNKADGFNLDVIQLRIDKPLDEQDWAAGYRADLWFGPDANVLGTSSTGFSSSDFGI